MLIKAISTGVVLAGLSGAMVYFGTEGADALDRDARSEVRVEETELAGAAMAKPEVDAAVKKAQKLTLKEKREARIEARAKARAEAKAASAEAELAAAETEVASNVDADKVAELHPVEKSETKPKRKWLDQYLKSNSSKEDDASSEEVELIEFEEPQIDESKSIDLHEDGSFRYEDGSLVEDEADLKHAKEAMKAVGEMDEGQAEDEPRSKKKVVKKKIVIKMDGDETATWTSVDGDEVMDEDFDLEMIEQLMRDHRATKTDVRVLRSDDIAAKPKKPGKRMKTVFDYEPVLEEAKKLQVIDMRNIAMFEIIDYAVDRGDFAQAADILQGLSDPELRDTARAKIGVGLASTGDSEAAFAVLDEMEIDELTASMRLEIIAALMATKAERSTAPRLR